MKTVSIDYDFLPQLRDAAEKAVAFFEDMCDLEFTVENGKLYVLSCRPGKRTGRAATMVAIDSFVEGLITGKVMLSRITPSDLYEMFDISLLLTSENRLITRGIPVSTGIAVGLLKLTPKTGADNSAAVARDAIA